MKIGPFSLAAENPAVPGCTLSGKVIQDTFVFSMAEGTDISPESYPNHKVWLALHGSMRVVAGREIPLGAWTFDRFISPPRLKRGFPPLIPKPVKRLKY